ncbi:MAG: peptidoglycan-binding domain-containing protein [Candidatus Acidiferrum sp.]
MMTRRSLRLALMVSATLGVGVLCGQSTFGTTPRHKKISGTKSASSGNAKSGTTAKSSHATTQNTGTSRASSAGSKAGASKTGGSKASASGKAGRQGAKKSAGGRQRGQMAPTPERITQIQQALAKNGALSGEPSGKWDDSTTDAMRKFQAAHGLNATGKLDAPTLNQLGLGASTAGIAAPTPAVKTSSTALPADIQQ